MWCTMWSCWAFLKSFLYDPFPYCSCWGHRTHQQSLRTSLIEEDFHRIPCGSSKVPWWQPFSENFALHVKGRNPRCYLVWMGVQPLPKWVCGQFGLLLLGLLLSCDSCPIEGKLVSSREPRREYTKSSHSIERMELASGQMPQSSDDVWNIYRSECQQRKIPQSWHP